MEILIYAVLILAAVSTMVFTHEFGHLIAAKHAGVKVLQFRIGLGPTLVSWTDSQGIPWHFCAVPLGALAEIKYDSVRSHRNVAGASYESASPQQRLVIASAGSGINFAASALVMLVVALALTTHNSVGVEIERGGAVHQAGMSGAGTIYAIDGRITDAPYKVGSGLLSRVGDTGILRLSILGEDGIWEGDIPIDDWQSDRRQIDPLGDLGLKIIATETQHEGLFVRVLGAVKETWAAGIGTAAAGLHMIAGDLSILNFGGALWTTMLGKDGTNLISEENRDVLSWTDWLKLYALFSIGLGVINLLPGPIVDGARIISSTAALAGRRHALSEGVEKTIVYVGGVFAFGPLVICIGWELMRTFG